MRDRSQTIYAEDETEYIKVCRRLIPDLDYDKHRRQEKKEKENDKCL